MTQDNSPGSELVSRVDSFVHGMEANRDSSIRRAIEAASVGLVTYGAIRFSQVRKAKK